MVLYIILIFTALCIGMAISVYAFGTGGKRKHIFQDIYYSVEDNDGIGVLYTKKGEYSAILKVDNPVQKYSANIDAYYEFTQSLTAIMQTLGRVMPFTSKTSLLESSSTMRVESITNFYQNHISSISRDETIQKVLVI